MGWVLGGSTRKCVVLFTDFGKAYTVRLDKIPSTSGHGVPLQKLFEFSDKEQVVGVVSCDPRVLPKVVAEPYSEEEIPQNGYILTASDGGLVLRLPLDIFCEPSLKTGRRCMVLDGEDRMISAYPAGGEENVCVASRSGSALIFPVTEVATRKRPGKGLKAIKLDKDDRLVGALVSNQSREGLKVLTNRGRSEIIRTTKYPIGKRGAKGQVVIKIGHLMAAPPDPLEMRLE